MADPASKPPKIDLSQNKANIMLRKAAEGKYAVPGVCVYNLEGILATIRAATNKRSPAMILLFPWAQTYSGPLLAQAAATAARNAPVPITLHLDHAQSLTAIHDAANTGFFDSIMVDMSHFDKEENLKRTRDAVGWCHERGIAVEAEPGRITGGEDGVLDTGGLGLEAVMTSKEEARRFVETGIDWLAPAFGNVHGRYGPEGIRLDYERLREVSGEVGGEVRLVLHGTDGFDEGIYQRCVAGGITKVNVNGVVNGEYGRVQREGGGGLSEVMERGTGVMQEAVERCMDMLGSSGKA
ncbi:putative fructose-bisphosphate aldolase [Usnea florida]